MGYSSSYYPEVFPVDQAFEKVKSKLKYLGGTSVINVETENWINKIFKLLEEIEESLWVNDWIKWLERLKGRWSN